jgi:hypothetical protein
MRFRVGTVRELATMLRLPFHVMNAAKLYGRTGAVAVLVRTLNTFSETPDVLKVTTFVHKRKGTTGPGKWIFDRLGPIEPVWFGVAAFFLICVLAFLWWQTHRKASDGISIAQCKTAYARAATRADSQHVDFMLVPLNAGRGVHRVYCRAFKEVGAI